MSLSLVHSRALLGLQAAAVTVEVHLANGLPSFTLVGLADAEVKEARERVRSALQNCGLEFPHNKRITVNLAPADLPKDSGRFDLPIALGILAASGQIDGGAAGGLRVRRRALAVGRAAAGARRAGDEPGAAAARRHARSWCCRPAAPRKPRWCRRPRCIAPTTCSTSCASSCRAQEAEPRRGLARASSPQPQAASAAIPIWPTSRARPAPSARWRSRRPAATAC